MSGGLLEPFLVIWGSILVQISKGSLVLIQSSIFNLQSIMVMDDRVAVIAIADGAPANQPNPVNALGAPVRRYIEKSLGRALADPSVAAVVLVGRPDGRGAFSAGADIREFAADGTSGGVTASKPTLTDLAALLEGSAKPVVAALTGACLGGGMELALAAQFRVADATLRYVKASPAKWPLSW